MASTRTPRGRQPAQFKLSEPRSPEIFGLVEKLEFFAATEPPQGRLHGDEDLPLGARRANRRSEIQLLRDVSARAWRTGSSASPNPSSTISPARAAKYDKLGFPDALLQLESAMDRKRVVATWQYLPLLDRIVKNESYMHTARARRFGGIHPAAAPRGARLHPGCRFQMRALFCCWLRWRVRPAQAGAFRKEQEELSTALAEAGSSPVEFLRAIEKHLARHPKSPRREESERAAVRAAIEAKDEKRIVLFGERLGAATPPTPRFSRRLPRCSTPPTKTLRAGS
jgi:hypothetical protein